MTKHINCLLFMLMTLLSFSTTSFAYPGTPMTPAHGGEIDLVASTISWLGKKVAGEHGGTISLKSGHLNFSKHALTGGSFVMDMTTIKCTDLDGEWASKLVGHLANEDFFEVTKFPTAELNITTVKAGATANSYTITGDLTIKGITKPVSFDSVVTAKTANATIKIDRTAYDIKYGSGSFFDNLGDKTINNEFELTVNIVMK